MTAEPGVPSLTPLARGHAVAFASLIVLGSAGCAALLGVGDVEYVDTSDSGTESGSGSGTESGTDATSPGSDGATDAGAAVDGGGEAGAPHALAAVDGGLPTSIGVSATSVYWADTKNQTVFAVPKGGAAQPSAFAGALQHLGDVLVVEETVYWADAIVDDAGVVNSQVESQSTQAGASRATFMGPFGANSTVYNLAFGGSRIWVPVARGDGTWLFSALPSGASGNQCPASGTSSRVAVNAAYLFQPVGSQVLRASTATPCSGTVWLQAAISDVVADATNLYWAVGAGVFASPASSAPPDAGGVEPLYTEPSLSPQQLAVDSRNLYWTASSGSGCDGTVSAIPIDGGTVTVVAKDQCNPLAIAVDGTGVYWTNTGDGSVWGAPLPK